MRADWYNDRDAYQYISPMLQDPADWNKGANDVPIEILKFPVYGARSYPISIPDCGGTPPGTGYCHPHTFKPNAPENAWAQKIEKSDWIYHYNIDYYDGIYGPYYVFFAGQQMDHRYEVKYRVKQAPTANFNHSPATKYNDTEVTFTNTSSDPDNQTLSYKWEYQKPGESTWTSFSTSKNPTKTLNIKGTWDIRLTVTDFDGLSDTVTKSPVVSNRAPVADFTYSPTTIYNNTTVTFSENASDADGDPLTYQWAYQTPGSSTWVNFSTAANPTKILNIKGTWNIRLTVTDPSGTSASVIKSPTVVNRLPVADFNYSPTTIYNNTNVNFTELASDPDGDTLTYQWAYQTPGSSTWVDFSTAANPTKILNIKGTWDIRLTVTDSSNSTASVTKYPVVINRAPVADFT
ncbi:PKD domain-containing protein, partial [Fictibacillus phosphorivorans]|uniref:PKD domain-containing protein n=1 Tax=Fictibacillus phosphorivorans TaxID=1221500 RepID=UPI001E343CFF